MAPYLSDALRVKSDVRVILPARVLTVGLGPVGDDTTVDYSLKRVDVSTVGALLGYRK